MSSRSAALSAWCPTGLVVAVARPPRRGHRSLRRQHPGTADDETLNSIKQALTTGAGVAFAPVGPSTQLRLADRDQPRCTAHPPVAAGLYPCATGASPFTPAPLQPAPAATPPAPPPAARGATYGPGQSPPPQTPRRDAARPGHLPQRTPTPRTARPRHRVGGLGHYEDSRGVQASYGPVSGCWHRCPALKATWARARRAASTSRRPSLTSSRVCATMASRNRALSPRSLVLGRSAMSPNPIGQSKPLKRHSCHS